MFLKPFNYAMRNVVGVSAFALVFARALHFNNLPVPPHPDHPTKRIAPVKITLAMFYGKEKICVRFNRRIHGQIVCRVGVET